MILSMKIPGSMVKITQCFITLFLQDLRTVEPNYIKLFKLAQLIIEYLLVSFQ